MVEQGKIVVAVKELLKAIGEDPEREGLQQTPFRVAKFWSEFMDYRDDNLGTTFNGIQTNQLVAVSGVRVWTLCEHHLLPFFCDLTVAYLVKDRVIGISKLARIAKLMAHRLNVQERLVDNIAQTVKEKTGSPDVAVIASGQHLCMSMRGIKTDAIMVSNVMEGAFRDNHALRMELLEMVKHNGTTAI